MPPFSLPGASNPEILRVQRVEGRRHRVPLHVSVGVGFGFVGLAAGDEVPAQWGGALGAAHDGQVLRFVSGLE